MKISPISVSTVETDVDPSLHSNDLDYDVERKFWLGMTGLKNPIGEA